jgi:hypothetical protein
MLTSRVQRRRLLSSGVLPNGNAQYYHYDSRGSTLALTDGSQVVSDQYAYDPFGDVVSRSGATENPFGYVGKRSGAKPGRLADPQGASAIAVAAAGPLATIELEQNREALEDAILQRDLADSGGNLIYGLGHGTVIGGWLGL